MVAPVVAEEPDYVPDHCAKYLARDNTEERHSFFGLGAALASVAGRASDAFVRFEPVHLLELSALPGDNYLRF
jgi:hypothetical protein